MTISASLHNIDTLLDTYNLTFVLTPPPAILPCPNIHTMIMQIAAYNTLTAPEFDGAFDYVPDSSILIGLQCNG